MKASNLCKETHYRDYVLHLPISKEEYYDVLGHKELFQECLNRIYRERPELFPDGFGEGFMFKDKSISRHYGICIRSIRLLSSQRVFTILPDFVKVDFNDHLKAKPIKTPKEIIGFILMKEAEGWSLLENDFRRDHSELYYAALKAYGTWKLVLETAGFSPRKAKLLCRSSDGKTSCR